MKKIRAAVAVVLCIIICLAAGCIIGEEQNSSDGGKTTETAQSNGDDTQSTESPAQNGGSDAIKIFLADAKELQEPYGNPSVAMQAVAAGANDFAFRLSAALAESFEIELSTSAGNYNLVCSPYSVWIPLAALVNATGEEYRDSLLEALSASGVSAEDVNNAASRMLYNLTKQIDKDTEFFYDPLRIANAVFVDKDVTLKRDFARIFLDYYRGAVINVDFSSEQAVGAVNEWASKSTEGLISEIVREFDPNTVAAIANAIYFSDRWQWEFDPQESAGDVFHSPTGDTEAVFMQREGDSQTYYEDDRVQAMPLRFMTGGGLYIILPKDGDATGLLASMTGGYFDKIQTDSISASGKLLLPRFSFGSPVMSLADTLAAMGVPLFDQATAPLTGGLIEENIPVWLSSAVHKAVIEVDEKGTTAAAVTVLAAAGAGPPEPTAPFEMICNSPFVFVLYSHTYDGGAQVLFTGIVNQP